MTAILALDATSQACSVALQVENTVIAKSSMEERSHAKHLLPFVEQLLQEASIKLDQLDAIACSLGPGSFTGLRIAFSFAQGLSYSLDKPLLGVNSLEAMAMAAVDDEVANNDLLLIPLFDARMNEVYWSVVDTKTPLSTSLPSLGNENTFASQIEKITAGRSAIAIGTDWSRVAFALSAAKKLNIPINSEVHISATSVLRLASDAYARGVRTMPHEVSLCYCRNSVAWNKSAPIRPR